MTNPESGVRGNATEWTLLERLAVVRTGAHVGPHVLVEHPHGRHLHVMLAFGALGCALAACLGGASLLLRKHLDIERLARDEGWECKAGSFFSFLSEPVNGWEDAFDASVYRKGGCVHGRLTQDGAVRVRRGSRVLARPSAGAGRW